MSLVRVITIFNRSTNAVLWHRSIQKENIHDKIFYQHQDHPNPFATWGVNYVPRLSSSSSHDLVCFPLAEVWFLGRGGRRQRASEYVILMLDGEMHREEAPKRGWTRGYVVRMCQTWLLNDAVGWTFTRLRVGILDVIQHLDELSNLLDESVEWYLMKVCYCFIYKWNYYVEYSKLNKMFALQHCLSNCEIPTRN